MQLRVFVFTATALVAFAANSVLNRLALKDELIDPVTFTQVRLFSAALILAPLLWRRWGDAFADIKIRAGSAAALFTYAICFSVAYVSLGAATGALILFGVVQFTMLALAVHAGTRPSAVQWSGVALAFAGLGYLLAPGVSAPAPLGALLMAIAGIAWGAYSWLGRGAAKPALLTASHFVLAVPLGAALSIIPLPGMPDPYATQMGVILALLSGVVASGFGYIIWYAALRHISGITASVSQLAVPVIAAGGGALFLSESLTFRLVIAGALTLAGIYIAIRPAPVGSR